MSRTSIVFLTLLISGCWAYLYDQYWQMHNLPMMQMWMPPERFIDWTLVDLSWVFGMWAVMMTAMMLPSALPMLNTFSEYCRRDSSANPKGILWFCTGYLLVWMLFSVALTLAQWLFHGWAWLSPMMENRQPLLAAAMLLIAGAYQFTGFKNACLHHCRTPLGYLLNHWQPGMIGALKIGFKHGLNCLGCCWAQMLIMFSIGIMNLAGMILITLWVIIEKSATIKASVLTYFSGFFFLVWGGLILLFR